jgi:hypothetical protein
VINPEDTDLIIQRMEKGSYRGMWEEEVYWRQKVELEKQKPQQW